MLLVCLVSYLQTNTDTIDNSNGNVALSVHEIFFFYKVGAIVDLIYVLLCETNLVDSL